MQVMRSTVSSSNGIGAKSRKYVVPGCSPSPSSIKKQLAGHVSGWLCKWLDVLQMQDVLNNIVDDISQFSCEFFCVLITCFMLIYHSPLLFFIFHQVVEKPFGFSNHVLQTNESFLNESNFPCSLSVYSFWAMKNVQAISVSVSTYLSISTYLIVSEWCGWNIIVLMLI